MRHDARPSAVAPLSHRSITSQSLSNARLYRPGLLFAAAVLLLPPIFAIGAAALSVRVSGGIPRWLPLVLLLWLPLIAGAWLTMISVRTSPGGIGAARPWSHWSEIRWNLIEHVQQCGPTMVVRSSEGRSLHFYPLLLQNGARLKREILIRLPAHVLDAPLRAHARDLLGEPLSPRAGDEVTSPLKAHPRRIFAAGLCAIALAGLVVAGVALALLPLLWGLVASVLVLVVAAMSARALPTALQTVSLDEAGITVYNAFGGQIGHLAWDKVQLVERTRYERVLRLRGEHRLRCAGPGLFAASEAEAYRLYLQTYCADRGAVVIVRRWL